MNAITRALNEHIVGEHGSSTSDNFRELVSSLDGLMELLKRIDALLAELELKIKERLAEQPINSFEELHAILIGKK